MELVKLPDTIRMKKIFKNSLILVPFLGVLLGCSTEKNTPITRTYHGINAHYNGYFNANILIDQAINSYRTNRKENFYKLLVIDPVPSESEVESIYPAVDTAIVKCKKVIKDHSMPSNDKPSKKKEEHNAWIDENWTTIGIASYYRRDYESAMRSFKFVKKFYSNDPSLFVGELWMAKTNIQTGKLTEAKFNLDNLDKAIQEEEAGTEKPSKSSSKKQGSKKSSSKKAENKAKFPKKIRFDFEKTKADLALKKGEKDEAIKYLESSLDHARFKDNTGRVHFILGQLYEEKGDMASAYKHFKIARKANVPYEMAFNARLKETLTAQNADVESTLNKMLRDAKNAPYKDQIYYTLGEIDMQRGDETAAFVDFTNSAFYSSSNPRQKAMAYERMANIKFSKRDYIPAQKYYDSCAAVLPEDYPNAEGIKNKAIKLADLVVAVETAQYEDSVQRIAQMDPDVKEKFLKNAIKQIKEEEAKRKEREAERLRELAANQNLFAQDLGSANKWYWNNPKSRAEGYDEFQQLWGQRENEDHWRRSDKTSIPDFTVDEDDTTSTEELVVAEPEDTLTVEHLMTLLPNSPEKMDASIDRLLNARYDAGIIYKEQLNEFKFAVKEFQTILDKKTDKPINLQAAFQLYQLAGETDIDANTYKNYILNNYPNSDYANYLRDPDYFIKKKERDALAEQEYVTVLDRYGRGLYYPVLSKANLVIENEKDNRFRAKYMLLKALCIGKTTEDKEEMLPVLNQLVDEYSESQEAVRANELINIIKNGYSINEKVEFGSDFIYEYEDKGAHYALIFLTDEDNVGVAKTRVSDFCREYFKNDRLKVTSKLFTNEQSVIMLDQFETEAAAKAYVRKYKETKRYLLDLQDNEIIIITAKNLKKLFETKDLKQYNNFFEAYY